MKSWLAVGGCAVATAGLLTLALPPVGWWAVGWFALAPLLWACAGKGFFKGFIGGIASSLLVAWLAVEGHLYAEKSFGGEPTWTYLGCAMFGFVLAVCCGIAGEVKTFTWRSVVGIAAFAVLLEVALMPVMPATIALTQSRVAGMMVLASVTGILGVAFAVWGFNVWLATTAFHGKWTWRRASPALGLAVLILLGYPIVTVEQDKASVLTVSVVQSASDDLGRLELFSREGDPAIAVWPEFGGMPFVSSGDTSKLIALAKKPGMPAVVTSFPDDFSPKPRNSASLFSSLGESDRYYKRKLFGGERNMHTPGDSAMVASLPRAGGELIVGLNICFDSCFPSLMRDTATMKGTALLTLPTIDPESPHGFLAAMHAAFTPFRAAEQGMAVARADAYAHSMIVSNTGAIAGELAPGVEGSLVRWVSVSPRWTVYKVLGDWFLYGLGITLLGLIGHRFVEMRRSRQVV